MIAHIHRAEHGQQEKADDQFVDAPQRFRICAHQHRERFAVPELVVAPVVEPLEDRMEALVRALLEVAEDGDVAGVADLFRQVRGVVDELGLEERVLLGTREKAQVDAHIEVVQRMVDESGMTSFIAAHVAEQLAHIGILAALLDLRVQNAAGKFRGH